MAARREGRSVTSRRQAREYGEGGVPVRDIDFTHPTYPNGTPRPDHTIPEQHLYTSNDPDNPRAGYKRCGQVIARREPSRSHGGRREFLQPDHRQQLQLLRRFGVRWCEHEQQLSLVRG